MTYLILAVGSFAPVARRFLQPVELNPGGPSFDEATQFSDEAKLRLRQNFERIHGTLVFWKTRAERYRALRTYSLFWMGVSAVLVPILAQGITADHWSKWLVTVISGHSAIMLTLVRTFRVEANYQTFRDGESDFYDLYRRMLDRPESFGSTEEERLRRYFEQVEFIRKVVRSAETDNTPSLEGVVASPPPATTA
ncbi:hypothetical protein ACFXO9_21040 [Nocardia tengchongensis]|uniref:hypothetical protein n=1 Tax=Nocardia tengchongensis TaxID=2055889 RepID=UPI00369853BD